MTDEWLEAAEKIDDDWKKMAKRIDCARNEGAHSSDCDMIYEKLGLYGKHRLLRLKEECKKTLNDLLDKSNI